MAEAQEDLRMYGTGDLAVFLGGSETSFTGLLIVLMAKADPGNLARLRLAFPREVRVWETWRAMSPAPTFAELRLALEIREGLAEAGRGETLDLGSFQQYGDEEDVIPGQQPS